MCRLHRLVLRHQKSRHKQKSYYYGSHDSSAHNVCNLSARQQGVNFCNGYNASVTHLPQL